MAHPRLHDHLCGTIDSTIEPHFKIVELHGVRHLGIPHPYGHSGHTLPDLADPTAGAQRGQSLRQRLIQGLSRDINGVGRLVKVVDNDSASLQGHESNLSHSSFVRLKNFDGRGVEIEFSTGFQHSPKRRART